MRSGVAKASSMVTDPEGYEIPVSGESIDDHYEDVNLAYVTELIFIY